MYFLILFVKATLFNCRPINQQNGSDVNTRISIDEITLLCNCCCPDGLSSTSSAIVINALLLLSSFYDNLVINTPPSLRLLLDLEQRQYRCTGPSQNQGETQLY